MLEYILQDITPDERKQILEDCADTQETLTYEVHLSNAEVDVEAKKLAEYVNTTNALEEEKKSVTKDFNDRINHVKEMAKASSDVLMKGTKEVTEICYKLVDPDTGEVGFYNELGKLVKLRKMTDMERQGTINAFVNKDKRSAIFAHGYIEQKQMKLEDKSDSIDNDNIEDVEFEEC